MCLDQSTFVQRQFLLGTQFAILDADPGRDSHGRVHPQGLVQRLVQEGEALEEVVVQGGAVVEGGIDLGAETVLNGGISGSLLSHLSV